MPDMDERAIACLIRVVEALDAIEDSLDNLVDKVAEQNAASLSDEELAKRVLRGQRALARRD